MSNTIALYRKFLNLHNATFERIDHEDAMVATVYKITTPTGGVPLILKICTRPQDYAREYYFLNYFASKLPVPRILDVVEPSPEIHGALLIECFPGTLLGEITITNSIAYEAGTLLARIHLNHTPAYGDLTQPETLIDDPRVPFTLKFEEGFSECSNHLPKTLLDQCHRYVSEHSDLLKTADGPCIIHRDFRPGNIMVDKNKIQGIIDWSSARASFAEEDFGTLEHDDWHITHDTKQSFLDGYATIRPVPAYEAIMPLLRISRAFATIGFTVKQGTWNTLHARVYQNNRHFLETFFQ